MTIESPSFASSESCVAPVSDQELVRRFVAHADEEAFAEIIRRHREKILVTAMNIIHNRADAEEIVQDTFVRAHRCLPQFRGDCALSTWLHRVATNVARNRYWYFHRRRRHLTLSLDGPLHEDGTGTFADLFASDAADPATENVQGEFSDLVATCLERLGPGQRTILTLRSLRDLSYEEIADQLGIKPGTVKSRIARARERLRALLAEASPEWAMGQFSS